MTSFFFLPPPVLFFFFFFVTLSSWNSLFSSSLSRPLFTTSVALRGPQPSPFYRLPPPPFSTNELIGCSLLFCSLFGDPLPSDNSGLLFPLALLFFHRFFSPFFSFFSRENNIFLLFSAMIPSLVPHSIFPSQQTERKTNSSGKDLLCSPPNSCKSLIRCILTIFPADAFSRYSLSRLSPFFILSSLLTKVPFLLISMAQVSFPPLR